MGIDLFGRIRRNVEAARAQTEQAKADFAATLLSVTANVAADYFALRALDAQVVILERTIATRQDALQIAEERLEAGLVDELDVARARSDVASDQAELFSIRRSRAEMGMPLARWLDNLPVISTCRRALLPIHPPGFRLVSQVVC